MSAEYNRIVEEWLGREIEDVSDPRFWFGPDGIFDTMTDFEIVAFQQILAKDESLGSVWDVITAGPEGWIEALIEVIQV